MSDKHRFNLPISKFDSNKGFIYEDTKSKLTCPPVFLCETVSECCYAHKIKDEEHWLPHLHQESNTADG